MAIVKMKKLKVVAAVTERDALLRELMLLGCTELREQEAVLDDPRTSFLVSRVYEDSTDLRTERRIFEDALRILDRYAPCRTPMLSPKPELSPETLMDDSREQELKQKAKELTFLEEKLRDLDTEETREKLTLEALEPWKGSGLPLDFSGTKHVAVLPGMLPAAADVDALSAQLTDTTEAVELTKISEDENAVYVAAFCLRTELNEVLTVLRAAGFTAPGYGDVKGLPEDAIKETGDRLTEIGEERSRTLARITAAAGLREDFRICYDRTDTRVCCTDEMRKLLTTGTMFMLEAWCVADRETEVSALLDSFECAYEFEDPAEEEYPEVPVKLRNNRLTDGLNMVTNMYSLPQYGSVDPNPLMAPFFILFYGIMMADMGYGVIMALIGCIILRKMRPTEGFMKYFAELMVEGGIATFIMGIFTGGLFGDAPKWVVRLINPASTWEGFPALIDPLNDTVTVLIGAMILGFIHLNAGMVISFVMKKRAGHLADAIWEEGAMWVLFLGAGLAVLGIGTVSGVPVVLAAALLLYCYGKTRGAKGIGKAVAILSGIYSDATGWFGDILSYARLMALMLAGSVIAQVFNTLGAMPGSLLIFIPICILGNALNFGLNLLGCYVHDLRLQCLEFFNKFYVAGGKPFAPLAIRSKFFHVTKKI